MAIKAIEARLRAVAEQHISDLTHEAGRRLRETLTIPERKTLANYCRAWAANRAVIPSDQEKAVLRLINQDAQVVATLKEARKIIASFERDPGRLLPG